MKLNFGKSNRYNLEIRTFQNLKHSKIPCFFCVPEEIERKLDEWVSYVENVTCFLEHAICAYTGGEKKLMVVTCSFGTRMLVRNMVI